MTPTLQPTFSLCGVCGERIPAELVERAGDVWMRKHCPAHGSVEARYWKSKPLFDEIMNVVGDRVWCRTHECLAGAACDECLPKTYNLMIEVTNRCNLDCPICCSDANNPHSPDPTIDQIIARLPPVTDGPLRRFRRPNVVLFGGEPTLRKDLPQIISAIVARGYVPRLATNGVRMTDPVYLQQLWAAGLRWVILQFDGFSDDVSQALRGERLVGKKEKAIETLVRHGFKVQLGAMIKQGANLGEVGAMIHYVVHHPRLFWLSFYPHSAQNRFESGDSQTHVSDVMTELERQTAGRITAHDFVVNLRLFALLDRLLHSPNLAPKLSTLPLVLLVDGGEFFPLVRLFRPWFALRHWRVLVKLLLAIPRLLRYQRTHTPPFVRFLVVEKMHNDATIDLNEASNCHMSFLTSRNYMPFDFYNVVGKKRDPWGVARGATDRAAAGAP